MFFIKSRQKIGYKLILNLSLKLPPKATFMHLPPLPAPPYMATLPKKRRQTNSGASKPMERASK